MATHVRRCGNVLGLGGGYQMLGRIMGSYVHGIFSSDEFSTHFVNQLGGDANFSPYDKSIETILDKLAEHIESHVNIDRLPTVTR